MHHFDSLSAYCLWFKHLQDVCLSRCLPCVDRLSGIACCQQLFCICCKVQQHRDGGVQAPPATANCWASKRHLAMVHYHTTALSEAINASISEVSISSVMILSPACFSFRELKWCVAGWHKKQEIQGKSSPVCPALLSRCSFIHCACLQPLLSMKHITVLSIQHVHVAS